MPQKSDVGKLASAKTKKQFADELSRLTTLTADEIQNLFPQKADRDELMELIQIVNSDTDDKEKKAELINKIGKVGGAVIKISKKIIAPIVS